MVDGKKPGLRLGGLKQGAIMAKLNLTDALTADLTALAAQGDAVGYFTVLADAGDNFAKMMVSQMEEGSPGNALLTGFADQDNSVSDWGAKFSSVAQADFSFRSENGFELQTSHAHAVEIMDAGLGDGNWYLDLPLLTAEDAQTAFEQSIEIYNDQGALPALNNAVTNMRIFVDKQEDTSVEQAVHDWFDALYEDEGVISDIYQAGGAPEGVEATPRPIFEGTDGNDVVRDDVAGHNDIRTGDGNDKIAAGTGYDRVDGGEGSDRYEVGANEGFWVNEFEDSGENGFDQIVATEDNAEIALKSFDESNGIERISNGGKDNVSIVGNGESQTLNFSTTDLRGISEIDAKGGQDTVIGSNRSDKIDAGSGHDVVDGGKGNDTIRTGSGNDQIQGGQGNDKIIVEEGFNTVDGGEGSDTYVVGQSANGFANTFNDTGTSGYDRVNASEDGTNIQLQHDFGPDAGIERIDGNKNEDVTLSGDDLSQNWDLSGTTLDEIEAINLEGGHDTLVGSNQSDTVNAGQGHDTVDGGCGNDVINGETGHDRLSGGSGNDTIDGGVGSDWIYGGTGNDVLVGDAGIPDSALVKNGSFEEGHNLRDRSWGLFRDVPGWELVNGKPIELQTGVVGQASEGRTLVELDSTGNSHVGQVIDTEPGGQYILSFDFSARRGVRAESNTIEVWFDGELIDTVTAEGRGLRDHQWTTKEYSVTAEGEEALLEFRATGINDSLGGMIDNVFMNVSSDDHLFGEDGNDHLKGGVGADYLDGGKDNDKLEGEEGDDELYGQEGSDTLDGGEGQDTLDGGTGNDYM